MSLFSRYMHLAQNAFFMALPSGESRAAYIRKHRLFRSIGSHVYWYSRIMPAEPELISVGNNVVVATNARILTHDRLDWVMCGMGKNVCKYRGCVEIGDNVFIGSDVTICPDIRIGANSFVAAGAVVVDDVPSGPSWGEFRLK